MADKQQLAAKEFVEYWKNKGYEKGQSQPFWLSLLRSVYGVGEPENYVPFSCGNNYHKNYCSRR